MVAQVQDTQYIYDLLSAYVCSNNPGKNIIEPYLPQIEEARDKFFRSLAIYVGGISENTTQEEIIRATVLTREIKLLIFYYGRKQLVDTVMERTAYIAKTRRDKELKTHLLDVIAVTQDDDSILTPILADASVMIMPTIAAFTKQVQNAHLHLSPCGVSPLVSGTTYHKGDKVVFASQIWELTGADENTVTGDTLTSVWTAQPLYMYTDDKVEFVLLQPDWFNTNMTMSVDVAIFEAMIAYMMHKWFMLVYPEEAGLYLQEFERCARRITSQANSTNAPLRRQYRMF